MQGKWEVNWKGPQVRKHVEDSAIFGINATMAAGLIVAKERVAVLTATLQGSLRIVDFARFFSGIARGRWGSADVNYALWQEIGTSIQPGQPYMRPAADQEYSKLWQRIKSAFQGTRQ